MKVIALSKSKTIEVGCIDCSCKNPDCEYFPQLGNFVDGGCASLPSGSTVELRCSHCGFRWERAWFYNGKSELVKIRSMSNHLFDLDKEDARKLSDVLIEIYEKE